eukprot:529848_1
MEDPTTIIPLPIEHELPSPHLKQEAETDPNEVLPPPLPVVNENTNENTYTVNQPQAQPLPSPPKYHSPQPQPRPPPRPRISAPAHLRPPPPLTPMDKIASDGSVIGMENNRNNSEYIMAPPPLPHSQSQAIQSAIEYNCNLCMISFNTKGELLIHKRNVHPQPIYDDNYGGNDGNGIIGSGRKLRFYCNICGRNFSGKQHYQYHMRTHSGEKPYTCQSCGKKFRAKHSLKNHIRIHTGERPYQCKVCGKWFRQLGVMKNHLRKMHSLK